MKCSHLLLVTAVLAQWITTDSATAGSVAFEYDQAGRLTTAAFSGGQSIQHAYAPSGNLTRRQISTGSNPDSDGDGLADVWEQLHFGNINATDGTGDFDHDGLSDLREFLAGTLPKDATSSLKVLAAPESNGSSFSVRWSAVSGRTYRLQFKNSLDEINWSNVPGDVTATSITAVKLDSTATNPKARFYRVQLVQ